MTGFTRITAHDLARLIGGPACPALVDVRTDDDFGLDPRLPGPAYRLRHADVGGWAPSFAGRRVVVICQKGQKLSEGAAAWLRQAGAEAAVFEGGWLAWKEAGLPAVPVAATPPRDAEGRTLWVTRERPKIDRIACPWLIRRFVDAGARFLFVAASQVMEVAERFGATPFDVDAPGAVWSHRGELCTFDVMVESFGLGGGPLDRLALIVRGADTARPELAPECAGLLAVSLGLSRLHADDLTQLEAGIPVYDALYRWCADGQGETHNWPARAA